ncbi:actin-like protein arp8 [Mortierella sp. GBA30]|nr:actin-like protein arp8 [Mortierella sp. GBA30]
MDDVHMDEAGVDTTAKDEPQHIPAHTSLPAAVESATQHTSNASENLESAIETGPAAAAAAWNLQGHEHATGDTSMKQREPSVSAAETSLSSKENMESAAGMHMDIDILPSDEVKSEEKTHQAVLNIQKSSSSVNGNHQEKPSDFAPGQPTELASAAALTSTAVPEPEQAGDAPESSQSNGHKEVEHQITDTAPSTGTAEGPVPSSEASTATKRVVSSLPPVRNYVPQFKFTTFSAMVPLPTRNVTSNFLKTDKNFVLKDMAAKRRRRKRKVDDNGPATEGGAENDAEDEDKEETENGNEEDALLPKKKRNNELSAIRRGIFADDENENEDEEDSTLGRKEEEDEDQEEYTSESDSEESVANEMDENGETKASSDAGKNIIVIHPGSRVLRIGRASDAYPVATPHCIARRMRGAATPGSGPIDKHEMSSQIAGAAAEAPSVGTDNPDQPTAMKDMPNDENAMDIDGEDTQEVDQSDVVNDRFLKEIEYDLKMRMKAAKRRPVPNAKTQVRSFNTSTRPERILDHNDPYKVEWTDPAVEGDFIIGQKALNLPPGAHHTFKLFWPIVGGKLNEQDYDTPRVVVSDLETIWTKVIQDDLGIDPKTFRKHYALLVIPDMYSKLYVLELVGMLLKSMQFRGVMVQQESVCASFGAGVSAACVVDIGAEVTKVACIEDGICIPNSRAVLKYGGDDITRVFTALVRRTGFPYQELDLAQTYDWRLMEELKEKWCTMNEADLTVQVYSFFVRKPEKQTEKYQVKVYDEVALSPMCLFFPGVIRRWIEQRETKATFAKLTNYEDINEDAPPISLVNQSAKKSAAAAAVAAAARAGTPSLIAPGEEANGNTNSNGLNVASNAGTPNPGLSSAVATPAQTPAPSGPSLSVPGTGTGTSLPVENAVDAVIPFAMEPSVRTTDKTWEIAGTIGKDHFSSLVALDVVVAQSISNCGSEERSKKLYGSIILVGGGGMVKGFDRVLEDRLFQALPATLTTVEKVEVLPSPREMDPRLLVWKGGSVLGKLDSAKELWIKPLEWELQGRKVLRDKALFVWSKD